MKSIKSFLGFLVFALIVGFVPTVQAQQGRVVISNPAAIHAACVEMITRLRDAAVCPSDGELEQLRVTCGGEMQGVLADLGACRDQHAPAPVTVTPPPHITPPPEVPPICMPHGYDQYGAVAEVRNGHPICTCPDVPLPDGAVLNPDGTVVHNAFDHQIALYAYVVDAHGRRSTRRHVWCEPVRATLNQTLVAIYNGLRSIQVWRDQVVDPQLINHDCRLHHQEGIPDDRCPGEPRRELPPGNSSSSAPGSSPAPGQNPSQDGGRQFRFHAAVGGLLHYRATNGAPLSYALGIDLQLNIQFASYADFYVAEFAGLGVYGNQSTPSPAFFAREGIGVEWYLDHDHRLSLLTGLWVHTWFSPGQHSGLEARGDYRGASGGVNVGLRYCPADHFCFGGDLGVGGGESYNTDNGALLHYVSVDVMPRIFLGVRF